MKILIGKMVHGGRILILILISILILILILMILIGNMVTVQYSEWRPQHDDLRNHCIGDLAQKMFHKSLQ